MTAYLILAAAAEALAQSADIQVKPIDYGSLPVLAFFCWRVSRRRRIRPRGRPRSDGR
jgi:hypothetical protein